MFIDRIIKCEFRTNAIKFSFNPTGVCVRILGGALCSWTESESRGSGKNSRTVRVHYEGRDDYLSSTTYLVGTENVGEIEILPGIHTYNFSCALPHLIPTSFEGRIGQIRYTISVSLERPWKFNNTFKVAFTVLKPYDLNYDSPVLRMPSQMETQKSFCCWPCSSGPLVITASIPQTGYVPGQTVKISVDVRNLSSIRIEEIRFILLKIVHYISQRPRIKIKEEIVDVAEVRNTKGVNKNESIDIEQQLVIPSVPPTNVLFCRVIKIQYELLVKATVRGMHHDPYIRLPITIGTVPLLENYSIPPQAGAGQFMPVPPGAIATHGEFVNPIADISTSHGFINPSAPNESPNELPVTNLIQPYRQPATNPDLRESFDLIT